MSLASRPAPTGRTRACPHCKAVVLESLSICPGCLHHLRFDSDAAKRQVAATTALKVDGVIRHPAADDPWEYFIVISIRNDRGEELDRKVVNVGALQGIDKRTFTLSVEVLPPRAPEEPPSIERPEPARRAQAPNGPVRPPATAGGKAPNGPTPASKASPPTGAAKAPSAAAQPPGASGTRLPDGTLLKPPGLGPKRR